MQILRHIWNMKLRISLPVAGLITIVFILASVLLINSLRIAYTRHATSSYNAALALWLAADHSSYTAIISSNSLTQLTGGTNTIIVEHDKILYGHNPECPNCPIEIFDSLTVEALFQRIETECLHNFPTQLCNVAYNQTLGYPIRIDTYPHNLGDQERPSITVENVQLLKDR